MPNYNQLILTGADYKFFLNIPGGGTYPLLTLESMDMDISVEEELIYALSEEDAIGNKTNARQYKGKFTIQVGEILAILALEGFLNATFIKSATIAVTAIVGGFQRTFTQVNITSDNISLKAKEKQSLANCNFTALGQS